MKAYAYFAIMSLCVILVPVIAYLFGEWYAYWGHAILSIFFGILVVFVKIRHYWEED